MSAGWLGEGKVVTKQVGGKWIDGGTDGQCMIGGWTERKEVEREAWKDGQGTASSVEHSCPSAYPQQGLVWSTTTQDPGHRTDRQMGTQKKTDQTKAKGKERGKEAGEGRGSVRRKDSRTEHTVESRRWGEVPAVSVGEGQPSVTVTWKHQEAPTQCLRAV